MSSETNVQQDKRLSGWNLFAQASRFYVLPVMVMPVLIGAVGAFAWNHVFHFWWLLLTVFGAATMHLFSNMINDLWDYRNGVDDAAVNSEDVIVTASGVLMNGTMSEQAYARWTWGLFAAALVSGLVLVVFRGPWVLFYGLLGALLAYFYVAPPIHYGYRGKGYSEISILLSFGVLPVLGSYYVQTQQYDTRALFVSLPVGLLTTLVLFNHHFLHWRADQASGKHTLVVVWGESKSLGFSKFLLVLSYVTVVLGVIVNALPWYSLISLVTVIPAWQAYRNLQAQNPSQAYLPLMGAALKASSRTGLILTVALIIQGFLK